MEKTKIFKENFIWSESLKNFIGIPRPLFVVPSFFYKKNNSRLPLVKNFYLHKKIPVPWQSKPIFSYENKDKPTVFNVITENEELVYSNNLCSFCGAKINDSDFCVRWKGEEKPINKITLLGPRVASDTHPLHTECMKQTRIFCPFMRLIKEDGFEYGKYLVLRKNADQYFEKNK